MTTTDPEKRFLDALQAQAPGSLDGPELLPSRLAWAAARALPAAA